MQSDSTFSSAKAAVRDTVNAKLPKTYKAPKVPVTPSATINQMLETRCAKEYTNPAQAAGAHYIAFVFTVITKVYEAINKEPRAVHTKWMAACGVVGLAILLKVTLAYQLLVASAFLVHFVLYYVSIAFSLFGLGLAVAGAVFFDKKTDKASTGFSEFTTEVKSTVQSARATVSDTFSKSD